MLPNKDGEMVINVPWLLDSVSSSEKTMSTGSFKELTVCCIQRKHKSVMNCHSDKKKPKKVGAQFTRGSAFSLSALTPRPYHDIYITNKQNHQDPEKNPQGSQSTEENNPKTTHLIRDFSRENPRFYKKKWGSKVVKSPNNANKKTPK